MDDTEAFDTLTDVHRLERQAEEIEQALEYLELAASHLEDAGFEDTPFSSEIDEVRHYLEDEVLAALPDPMELHDEAERVRGGTQSLSDEDVLGLSGEADTQMQKRAVERELNRRDLG